MRQPTPTSARDIGNAYIEHGAICDRAAGSGCFLDKDQRRALVSAYQQRVLSAQNQYQHALADLRVDKLVEKDDDLWWVATFVLDLVGLAAVGALAKAAALLRGSPENVTSALVDAGVQGAAGVDASMISDKSLESVVRTAITTAKTQVTRPAKAAQNLAHHTERSLAVSYIDVLKNDAAVTYQHLREDPPASASDAELVALFTSFDAENGHTIGEYKQALTEKLARFQATWIPYVGRKYAGHLTPLHDEDRDLADATKPRDAGQFIRDHGGGDSPVMRDLKVAWVRTKSTGQRTLFYIRQDFAHEPGWSRRALEQPHQLQPVEPEFAEVAVRRHIAVWGSDPEELVNDDTAWMNVLRGTP
jgi:hypothetical protein